MTDPASTTMAAAVAAFSGVTLALFGLDYYSLLWAFIGALLALRQNDKPMGRASALLYVTLTTLAGAALGNAMVAAFDLHAKAMLISACLCGSYGAQFLISKVVLSLGNRIDIFGGVKP